MWKAEQIMAPEVDERSQYYEHQQSTEEADVPAQNSSRTNVYECTTLLCVCNFIGTVKHSNCRTPDGQILQPALRKEYRQLSATERNRFHNALSKLKSTGEYKLCGGAHSGPAFLPWHREYIKRFELALRKIDFTVSLPYWDSTLEGQLQDGKDSCLFEAELMGRFKRATNYSDQVYWTSLEYSNGNVLLWLGGETFQPSVSANDPLFFMHHAFLDKLWEDWRQKHQTMADRTTAYPRDSINCSSEEHFANSPMRPFNQLRNIDGISDFYTKNLYRYQERATCPSGKDEQCGSSFLFCDRSHREPHCAAKVRYGGNCIGFENNENPCISGRCVDGICT
uniref:Tyrosinase_Cu-bd domain-containing protein n=1 Tax=Syphacia muris TaxID=451379 RepID=A0A0N5AUT7_9BILA